MTDLAFACLVALVSVLALLVILATGQWPEGETN